MANGGAMPVELRGRLLPALDHGSMRMLSAWHQVMTTASQVPLLGDVIHIPGGFYFSFGDLLIFTGGVFMIQRLMGVPINLKTATGRR